MKGILHKTNKIVTQKLESLKKYTLKEISDEKVLINKL